MLPAKISEILSRNRDAVVTTFRKNGAVQMSIVTVGPYKDGVAFTINPGGAKLANFKRNPRCSLMVAEPDWSGFAVLEGYAQVLSPGATDPEEFKLLLREIYRTATGEEHPDWEEFDQAVRDDGRSAVILAPEHVYHRTIWPVGERPVHG
jgi:PPOX class probable F420-dependent enzyme